jgi:hypothetical protein
MPSVTAICNGVRPAARSPCLQPHQRQVHAETQLSLQPISVSSALECGFTGSTPDTYVRSHASVRTSAYRYEHMFPQSIPSPLTRRARSALSLARSFLLLEDDYDVDWEVDQDESGQDRSKIDEISDRPARERRDGVGGRDDKPISSAVGRQEKAGPGRHPHRGALRGRSARVRAGEPAPAPQVCLCPVEHSATAAIRRTVPMRTGRPQATRK